MNQLRALWDNLSLKQKVSLAAAAVAVIAGLVALGRWNKERDFKPLYTGLSAEDAGAVLAKLRESGVEYRLSENGGTVLAPSARVAELRLQMAAAGLPKTGRLGFELFDRTNLGATDFAEQVNYHRALEGELERSVMALAEVEQARVHVTLPKDSVFLENRQPAKASVMLKLRSGARLSPQNVQAVMHLVASAVQGLQPEAVSVLDMQGNLLNRARRIQPEGSEASEAAIEFRQRMEKDLLVKIQSTLEPLLGADRFRAGVYVDCDLSSGEVSEETVDPAKSAPLTMTRTLEGAGVPGPAASGIPGTPSNLPRPVAAAASASAGVARQTENVSYQNSRTVRHTKLPQGSIRKVSVALLIDHNQRWEGAGAGARRVTEPPSPERLKAIREVVAGAVGFNAQRGDQLIVESLPFETTLPPPPEAPSAPPANAKPGLPFPLPPWLERLLGNTNLGVLAGVAAGIVLFLIGAAVLVWVKTRRKRKHAALEGANALPAGAGARPAIPPGGEEAEIERALEAKLAEQKAARDRQAAEMLNSLKVQPVTTKKTEVLTKHIAEETKKDPSAMAQIVRGWLSEGE